MSIYDYQKSLKNRDVEEPIDSYLFRPLGHPLVKFLFLRTDVTANHVTWASFAFAILSAMFFLHPSWEMALCAAILFQISNILDCCDGQLARLRGSSSRFGRMLDGVTDYIGTTLMMIGLTVHLYRNTADPWSWVLAAFAGASYAIHCMMFDFYKNQYVNLVDPAHSEERLSLRAQRENARRQLAAARGWDRLMWTLALAYFWVSSALVVEYEPRGNATTDEGRRYAYVMRPIMRLWGLFGPSTHVFLLMPFVALGRLDAYLWLLLTVGNGYALLLSLLARRGVERLTDMRLGGGGRTKNA